MRAAIYNPYLDTLGGGERYTMTVALVLSEAGYKVDVQWPSAHRAYGQGGRTDTQSHNIKQALENRFGMDLGKIGFIPDVKRGDGYDVCFWLSDGSIPMLRARINLLHFQVPFKGVEGKSLLNRMKLFRINKVICNSYFTKGLIDKEYGVESVVIYPPVDVTNIKPKKKENIIAFVGRFSQLKQAKNQGLLVDAFKRLYDDANRNWKLYLAGGVEVGEGKAYVDSLRKKSVGYPVNIIESPYYSKIVELYGKAKVFWSASGFGVDENANPEKAEHFGITVVEAMAGGAVPIVFEAGGHREIVKEAENGYLWRTEKELIEKTRTLIVNNKKMQFLASSAARSAKRYSESRFKKEILSLLN